MSTPDKPGDFVGNVKRRKAQDEAKEKARNTAQKPRRATNRGKAGGYVAQALSNELDNIRNATEGTRNATVNTALFNLGTLGADNIDITLIKDSVRLAARSIGLSDREIDKLLRDDPDSGLNKGMSRARDMSSKRPSATTDSVRLPPPPPPVIDVLEDIEDGFWDSRESLSAIYIGALSKLASPWAVLAVCIARALATVRPTIVLPDLIGGPGSLNWFGAITAASGGGKGAASACARQLVNVPILQRNTGSGEGMIGAFVRPANPDTGEPKGLYESVMFNVDEIDSLTAQSSRNGATTMSVLRSAFSGETLGFSYVNKNTPTLMAHTYRMTMIVSVQPQRAATLLEDAAGGTPQRFMWFPGNDKRVSADLAGGWVTPLTLPNPGTWAYDTELSVPKVCADDIIRERVRAMRGESDDPLAGHGLFVREKFAFGLALLDGRAEMTDEDWALSAVASKVSDSTRYWIGNLAEEARIAEAYKRGELLGVSSMAADEKRSNVAAAARRKLQDRVLGWIKDAGLEGIPKRTMQQRLKTEAKAFDGVAQELQESGLIRFEGKRWYAV